MGSKIYNSFSIYSLGVNEIIKMFLCKSKQVYQIKFKNCKINFYNWISKIQ